MANEAAISEPVISLTPSAAEQVRSMIASQPEQVGKCLRVYVEAGGCSGLQHAMTLDEKRDGDFAAEFFGVPVVVDRVSAEHLRGATIDFSEELTGGGFKVTIPKAQSSCGCGKSFAA
jgi:iron-sulfur cluster assembly accessory protein